MHYKPIPCHEKTGFSLWSFLTGKYLQWKQGSLQWEQGFPVMKTGFSLCEKLHRENPVLALYWPCTGLQCCNAFANISHLTFTAFEICRYQISVTLFMLSDLKYCLDKYMYKLVLSILSMLENFSGLTVNGMREGTFHPFSFLDQILSTEFLSTIFKLFGSENWH